jgi:hypothetical protein
MMEMMRAEYFCERGAAFSGAASIRSRVVGHAIENRKILEPVPGCIRTPDLAHQIA